MKTFLALFFLVFSTQIFAEEFSVSATCDEKHKVFSLDPVVSSEESGTLVYEGNGSELDQSKTELKCKLLSKYLIKLKYQALAPQPIGMCMGQGFTEIFSIKINDYDVYGDEAINSGCFSEQEGTLVSLKLYLIGSKFKLRTCRAKDWVTPGYVNRSCKTQNISLTPPSSGSR
jgi:hypothetical protein